MKNTTRIKLIFRQTKRGSAPWPQHEFKVWVDEDHAQKDEVHNEAIARAKTRIFEAHLKLDDVMKDIAKKFKEYPGMMKYRPVLKPVSSAEDYQKF